MPSNDQGKPICQTGLGADPSCRYNLYKFDEDGQRIKPEMFICTDNNTFQANSETYANFHGDSGIQQLLGVIAGGGGLPPLPEIGQIIKNLVTEGVPGLIASRDISPHQCRQQYGETLQPLPVVTLDTYTLPEGGANEPTDAEIEALCTQDTGGKINYEALAKVNCPTLSQYHLFEDPTDPSQHPKGHSVGYDLNTKLFSDYAVKFRFVFLPPGATAHWPDTPKDNPNATLIFPVGTVIRSAPSSARCSRSRTSSKARSTTSKRAC